MKNLKILICIILALALLMQVACATAPAENSSAEESGNTDLSVDDGGSSEVEESSAEVPTRAFTAEELKDRIEGSWAAQMIGVTWGASTEFCYLGRIIPVNEVPEWKAQMINDAFGQDDLYVEIPFLDTMYKDGVDCTIDALAEAFRDTEFGLDHANYQGRANLRAGIPAPQSGSYLYNYHCDDIDWQIEADFLGNLYPGQPAKAAERAFEIGHIMNYGDGVYGGVYIAVMHAAAYTAESVYDIAEAGRLAIPEGSKFRAVLDKVTECYNSGKGWQECWDILQTEYGSTARCVKWRGLAANIDAKLNAAYVHMGLLWGNGDLAETIKISMRCGQDSDCNPSSAAGVLGTFYGFSGLPSQYTSSLDSNAVFSGTDYSFGTCVRVSCSIVERVLEENGVQYIDGEWLVPVQNTETYSETGLVPYEQWPSDVVCAYLYVSSGMRGKIRLETAFALPEGYEGEVVETLDMGYGTVPGPATDTYKYSEDGTYEIRYTVKAGDKESTAVAVVTVKGAGVAERGFSVTPSCSTKLPTGGGNKDINVIVDENCPNPSYGTIGEQYDTYTGSHSGSEWFALEFDRTVLVTDVVFTEGMHFDNGGWFSSAPKVQVLKDGKWTDAETECDIPYGGHDSFTTFTFALVSPEWCEGVRVTGKPGGSAVFASCAELDVMFDGVKDAD